MIFCGECGTQLADNISFCSNCGAKIQKALAICNQCGQPMPENTFFCSNCGSKRDDESIPNPSYKPHTLDDTTKTSANTSLLHTITNDGSSDKPIRPLVCELCGGNNLIKQDGLFACQSCGTKYTLEEARKLMIEGTVQVQGTVTVDNSNQISNYLVIANNSLGIKNYDEAEKYANMVLELDSGNPQAWFLKGKIELLRSLLNGDIKLSNCMHYWSTTIRCAGTEHFQMYMRKIADELSSYNASMISQKTSAFAVSPTNKNTSHVLELLNLLNTNKQLRAKAKIPVDCQALQHYLAANMVDSAIRGFNNSRGETKRMNTIIYTIWLEYTDNCIDILMAAMDLADNEVLLKKCYDSACLMHNEVLITKSYSLQNGKYTVDKRFTRKCISERNQRPNDLKNKYEFNRLRIQNNTL